MRKGITSRFVVSAAISLVFIGCGSDDSSAGGKGGSAGHTGGSAGKSASGGAGASGGNTSGGAGGSSGGAGGSSGGSGGSAGSGTGVCGSGFVTPDILDDASFETGWDGFTDWAQGPTPTGVTRATDYAYDGSYSVSRTWTPNPGGDTGSQFAYSWSSLDRIWVRFYFRLTASLTTIMKFARFYSGGFTTNLGGLYMESGQSIFSFGGSNENQSITTWFGLSEAGVIDGNWHSIEFDYWRNGDPSGYPSAAFWFDCSPVSMPDGADVKYAGTTGQNMYWQNGRLNFGERASSEKLDTMEWLATLNGGNTTTGQVNIDCVSISSLGRIGPGKCKPAN